MEWLLLVVAACCVPPKSPLPPSCSLRDHQFSQMLFTCAILSVIAELSCCSDFYVGVCLGMEGGYCWPYDIYDTILYKTCNIHHLHHRLNRLQLLHPKPEQSDWAVLTAIFQHVPELCNYYAYTRILANTMPSYIQFSVLCM